MDYGVGRFTLASALYTKWAFLERDGHSTSEAQRYYQEAEALSPYREEIINKTEKYDYTRITAQALRNVKK